MRVENLEALGQVGELEVRAQEAVAQAMESANPHPAHVDWQQAGEARHHLPRCLVGKSHGQHACRRNLAGLQEPGNTRCQNPGLAGSGTRQDQGMLARQRDGGALLGVKTVQQRKVMTSIGCNF